MTSYLALQICSVLVGCQAPTIGQPDCDFNFGIGVQPGFRSLASDMVWQTILMR